MEPTLIPGDIIMVSKMSYGARLLKLKKFFYEDKIEYQRTWGWSCIKKGDLFVFNLPNYDGLKESKNFIYGGYIVKRCYGLPGDTIIVRRKNSENVFLNVNSHDKNILFPHDSVFKWSLNDYGPLYVPGKKGIVDINYKNLRLYGNIIKYENYECKIGDSVLWLNGSVVKKYKFRNNYYFMLGDNFYGSQDSRYWGFVPEENIIGKAKMILFSFDVTESLYKGFRWNHFFKIIR